MKSALVLVISVFLVIPASWAQSAPSNSDDTPASKEDVEQLFAATHVRQRVHNVMEASSAQMRQALHDNLTKKYPDLKQEDIDRLESFFDQVLKDYDVEAIVDDMIPAYQRHLNKSDVAAMLAFYNTPTGQKVVNEMPAIMSEATQAARPRMEKAVTRITDQAEKMAKEEQEQSTPPAKH